MKKTILAITALFLLLALHAQNDKGDNIIGTYLSHSGKDTYKVSVVKLADGSYKASICWLADRYDANGKLRTDSKNPDKQLRSNPLDKVVLFSGLKYDASKQNWSGTKIYDPTRGLSAKMTAHFTSPGTLSVRGTLLGISETATWSKQD